MMRGWDGHWQDSESSINEAIGSRLAVERQHPLP